MSWEPGLGWLSRELLEVSVAMAELQVTGEQTWESLRLLSPWGCLSHFSHVEILGPRLSHLLASLRLD